jgi:putative ABC transport system permease protein
LRLGDKATPYSVVSAISPSDLPDSIVPKGMADDEILINQWLADDLGAKKDDTVQLTYYIIGPTRQLVEATSGFRVRDILPMSGKAIDADLMPDFPGLTDVQNCRDWKPGIPIDLDKIRPKDEQYWDKYRGTPKAFVTLAAGQKMWANRYGNLTAIRYPISAGLETSLTQRLLIDVKPASLGLFFMPVRQQALAASTHATDFGQLFIGFSMFLIAAAVILMVLLFAFGVEKRGTQTGMLLAIGLPPKLVKRLLLLEGLTLAAVGSITGALCGLLYTKAMISGLTTIWSGAVSGSWLTFHARLSTLLIAAFAGLLVSIVAIWLTLRKQLRQSPRDLLDENAKWQFLTFEGVSKGKLALILAALCFISAIALLAFLGKGASAEAAGAFFGAGALLLIAGILLINWLLKQMAAGFRASARSISGLGLRNSTRRPGRSLAVVILLAAGVFVVIAVGANRQNPLAHTNRRASGTGGFALYAESSIPILYDLNTEAGRKSLGFRDDELAGISFVQLRLRQGDDASCFNLNRAQTPRLLGVEPEQLKSRNAFLFTKSIGSNNTWELLNADLGENMIPAVGDSATITWALGKSIGDDITYTDDAGNQIRVRLAGMLKNSILQGSLLISEQNFIRYFGSEPGYRIFLIDTPADKAQSVSRLLSERLRDFGFDVTAAPARLAAFSAVENTYLSIFQMLGGLGLILGSLGLGMVVLRNVLDRRGELAMLRAVGFDKDALKSMVFSEHATLMFTGLALGVAAAIVAVAPALSSPGAKVPYVSLALTITAIAAAGVLWIWLAASLALSGELLDALRSE